MKNNFPITYIMHCKKLKERKEELDRWIHEIPKKPIFINDYDAEELNKETINKYYQYDEKICKDFFKNDWKLNNAEISLNIKHIKAIEDFLQTQDEIALFLEDDAIPINITSFKNEINECLLNTPLDADMIFIGRGISDEFINKKINKEGEKVNDKCYKIKSSNCSESYLITRKVAKKLIKQIIPFHFCIDWELEYRFKNSEYNIYWWVPPIFEQGSKNGKFKSTLDQGQR